MKLKTVSQNQSQKEVVININSATVDHVAFGCYDPLTTGGLTFGFTGGYTVSDSGTQQQLNDGTVSLTANATNYIEYSFSSNSVVVNQTAFTVGNVALYIVVAGASSITSISKVKAEAQQKFGTPIGGSTPLSNATPLANGTASAGTSGSASRADHVHPLPAVATQTTDGLMSATDKTKLDGLGSSGVTQIIAGSNITISPTGGTGAVTINATGGGSTSLSTKNVFDLKSASTTSLVVGVYGGKANNIAGSGFYNSSNNIRTIPDTNITLPANSSGYIVYRNNLGGSLTYVDVASVYTTTQKPLYYFVTNSSGVTTLDDVRHSFVNFDMFAPIKEIVFTSWTTGTVYSSSVNFVDLNTTGSTWNLLPRRIVLQCTTSELGYAAGDMSTISTYEPAVVISQGFIRVITQTTLPQVLNRTAGSIGALATVTAANWKIVLILEPVM